MAHNMKEWSTAIIEAKDRKYLPVLFFPSCQLCNYNVQETVTEEHKMAEVIIKQAERFPEIIATMTGMDLSIDPDAFGCSVRFKKKDTPAVTSHPVVTMEDVQNLVVPDTHAARQDLHYSAVSETVAARPDMPCFGGMLGPFSLAANLMDLADALTGVIERPEVLHALLEKSTQHLINRAKGYKEAGASGILLAEPTAGLLAPEKHRDFSCKYVKQIVDAVQDDNFFVVLHDCANVTNMVDDMYATGAKGLHFGNAVDMEFILSKIPADRLVFGNIEPAVIFTDTPEEMKARTLDLLKKTAQYPHFVLSSGCDVPVVAPLENIDAMIEALKEYNQSIGC